MEHIRILRLGASFRVYISYKIRTRQKSGKDWKSGNGRNAWSPQRVHFSDWVLQKFVLDQANSQMYQSHKTLINTAPAQRNEPPTDVHTTIPGQPSVLPVNLRFFGLISTWLIKSPFFWVPLWIASPRMPQTPWAPALANAGDNLQRFGRCAQRLERICRVCAKIMDKRTVAGLVSGKNCRKTPHQ